MKKRFLSTLLCCMLVLSMLAGMLLALPMPASAEGDVQTATLVKSVDDLAVGDKVIIVAAGYDYALSTNQKADNRGATAITKDGDNVSVVDGVQVLTLEAGTTDGTFAFNTGAGYLYAASSSSNKLKTEDSLSDNSSWSISIENSGVATVTASGEQTHNLLRYYHTTSNQLFSCYEDGQKDINIYKIIHAHDFSTGTCPCGAGVLTFSSDTAFTLKTYNTAKNWDGTLEYSTDLSTWTVWTGTEISSSAGGKLYLRGTGNTYISGANQRQQNKRFFLVGNSISCSGNIMTLLDYQNPPSAITGEYAFAYLFYNCANLINAPEMPATALANHCYQGMFQGCTSLQVAPSLPATALADYCYNGMFASCTALEVAPELPATTLADYCYGGMFNSCTALEIAPELPATTLADYCYIDMFSLCTALKTAPELPATELTYGCYSYMFQNCTSLTTVPELPATTLAELCYSEMFQYCTGIKLNASNPGTAWSIPADATTASYWNSNMFYGSGGTFKGEPTPGTTYYYVAPTPTPTPAHTHPECGDTDCGDHGEAATYQALTHTSGILHIEGGSDVVGVNRGDPYYPEYVYTLPAGNYYLAENIALDGSIKIDEASVVNLCLGGKTLSSTVGSRIISIPSSASNSTNLTVCDCAGGGIIDGGNEEAVFSNGDTLTVYGGTFTSSSSEQTAYIYGTNIYGGSFINTGSGVALYNVIYDVNIYGGTFTTESGSVLNVKNLNVYGGTFTNNSDTNATIIIDKSALVKFYGGTFTNNNANGKAMKNESNTTPSAGFPAEGYEYVLPAGKTIESTSTFSVAEAAAHTHIWSEDYMYDETHHWHSCNSPECDVPDGNYKDVEGSGKAEHNIVNNTCTDCGAHFHGSEVYTSSTWSENFNYSFPGDNRSTALKADSRSGNITVQSGATLSLCLNGHTLDLGEKTITVRSSATLNIYDCQGTGKIISTEGMAIDNSGTVNIYGGTVEGETYAISGGVANIHAGKLIGYTLPYPNGSNYNFTEAPDGMEWITLSTGTSRGNYPVRETPSTLKQDQFEYDEISVELCTLASATLTGNGSSLGDYSYVDTYFDEAADPYSGFDTKGVILGYPWDIYIGANESEGYVVPKSVTITVGGAELSADKYTYNRAKGTIHIPAVYVTGDIVVDYDEVEAEAYDVIIAGKTLFSDDCSGEGYTYTHSDGTGPSVLTLTNADLAGGEAGGYYLAGIFYNETADLKIVFAGTNNITVVGGDTSILMAGGIMMTSIGSKLTFEAYDNDAILTIDVSDATASYTKAAVATSGDIDITGLELTSPEGEVTAETGGLFVEDLPVEEVTIKAAAPTGHTHEGVTGVFTELTDWAQLATSGNYYLGDTVPAVSEDIMIAEGVNITLCLNGKTLDLGNKVIRVNRSFGGVNGELTICDCQENQGTIKSSNAGNGTITNSGILTVTGGTVEKTSLMAAAVYNSGTATIEGGKIIGGGAAVSNNGTLIVRGDAVIIEENKNAIYNDGRVYLSGAPELSGALADIKVSSGTIYAENNGEAYTGEPLTLELQSIDNKVDETIVSGITEANKNSFILSGTTDYLFEQTDNGLVLKKSHSHSWSTDFTTNETHHWHECKAADCTVSENADKQGYAEHTYVGGNCECGLHIHSWSTDFTTNETHHWHECENASCAVNENADKQGYAEHNYVNGNCECGLHIHAWAEVYTANGTAHWHECENASCPITLDADKGGYEAHFAPADDDNCKTAVKCPTCEYVFVAAKADHTYIYAVNGAVITETCSAEGCTAHTATATIKAPEGTLVYDGNTLFAADVTYSDNWQGEKPVIAYTRNTAATSVLTEAGAYVASITVGGKTASAAYTIKQADGNITNISDIGKTYDNIAVSAPTFNKLGTGAETVEYKVKGEDDSKYSTTAPKNAGDYTVRVTVAADSNYKQASATADFTIGKADYDMLGITFVDGQFVYDGQAHSLVIGGTLPTGADGIQVTVDYSGSATNVSEGEVTVTATFATASANYNIPIAMTAKVKIEAKEIIIDWCENDYTYNGAEQTVTATYNDINGNPVSLTLSVDGEFKDFKQDSYVFTAAFKYGETNYSLPDDVTNTYDIKKRDIADAVIVLGEKPVYNRQEQTQTLSSVTVADLTVTYTVSGNKQTTVGINDYELVITGVGNFTGTAKKAWNIEPASVPAPKADTSIFTYTGSVQTYKLAKNELYTISGNMRILTGSQFTIVSLNDPLNYKWSTGNSDDLEYLFTIEKRVIDIPDATDKNFYYTGSEQKYFESENPYYFTFNNTRTGIGTQTVTLSLKDNSCTEWSDGSVADLTYTFTISKAASVIFFDNFTPEIVKVYGEKWELPVPRNNVCADVEVDITLEEMKNVGHYTITYSIAETENYTGSSKKIAVIIEKQQVAIPDGDDSVFVYNGKEQTYLIAEDERYIISGNTRTASGSQTVTAALADKDNYEWSDGSVDDKSFTFSIAKQTVIPPTESTVSYIYNGRPQTYLLSPDERYTLSNNIRKDAGKQTVAVSLTDAENYEWFGGGTDDLTFDFIIAKADAIIYLNSKDIVKTYGDALKLPSATSNFGQVKVDKTPSDMVNAGEYTVTYYVDSTDNYNGAAKTINVKILKQKVSAPKADTTVFTYTGRPHTYYLAKNDRYTISDSTLTDAGSKAITVSLKDKNNYEWFGGGTDDLVFTFTVNKANASITVDTADIIKTYGEAWSLPYAHSNFGEVKADKAISDMVNAGEYTVTYYVEGTDNYNGAEQSISVKINKATYNMSAVSFDSLTFKENGEAFSLAIGGTLPNGVSVEYTGNAQVKVGTYTVVARFIGNENYNAISDMSATLTINRPELTDSIHGEAGSDSPDVIISSGNGFDPKLEAVISELDGNSFDISAALEDSEFISLAYDIALKNGDMAVQPDGSITIKLLLAPDTLEREFRIIHRHGEELTEIDYTIDGNYAIFQVDSLSEFFIVCESSALVWLTVSFSAITLAEAGVIIWLLLRQQKLKKTKTLASVSPIFFAAFAAVNSSLILCIISGVLMVAGGVVLAILALKASKQK